MEHQYSATLLRQRKFFVWLPVFVVPFITLFFVLLGGGGAKGSARPGSTTAGGLNMQLPDAHNAQHPQWTKLDFYKQADADSVRRKQLRARDPYYQLNEMNAEHKDSTRLLPVDRKKSADTLAAALRRQIHQMNQQLNEPVGQEVMAPKPEDRSVSANVSKLETLLRATTVNNEAPDPEMEQLHGMLNKIYAIQHPEITDQQRQDSIKLHAPKAYAIQVPDPSVVILVHDSTAIPVSANGFYSIDEHAPTAVIGNSFAAIVAENQTLVSGAILKLRLNQDIDVNGITVPADQLLYGVAHLNGERLEVSITSIRAGQQLLPVKLSVYDFDGLPGIAIPGAITGDVLKQSAGQSMQNIGMLSVDPSVGAQAASAGIQAAKTLLHKKIQLTKVMVTAGYEVLLRNDGSIH